MAFQSLGLVQPYFKTCLTVKQFKRLQLCCVQVLDAIVKVHVREESGDLIGLVRMKAKTRSSTETVSPDLGGPEVAASQVLGLLPYIENGEYANDGIPVSSENSLDVVKLIQHKVSFQKASVQKPVTMETKKVVENKTNNNIQENITKQIEKAVPAKRETEESSSSNLEMYEAAYEFDAMESDQLSLSVGDRVFVLEKADD